MDWTVCSLFAIVLYRLVIVVSLYSLIFALLLLRMFVFGVCVDRYFTCPHLRKVGGLGDGPKWTCDVERLTRVVERRRQARISGAISDSSGSGGGNGSSSDCLIYSIGSNGNYRWEDGLLAALGPICEIHIFDPGNYDRPGQAVDKNMHYHRWGLTSSYAQKGQAPKREQWKVYSFQEIQRKLGHENRTLDVLKIDCEGCEWYVFWTILFLVLVQSRRTIF
jgi:hypothetical protein